ncbi:competence protein CoiA [Rhodohalobacter mucosus]|nr:competence protein CoiA family protein [Rhodohalobacter mucosus]
MKFALIDGMKTKATKGAKGICQCCGSGVYAKCGPIRIHHWAHEPKSKCKSVKEGETRWHRAWKENYPESWQEIKFPDDGTGTWHVADIKTEYDLVIEFQHSHISPKNRSKRESFYQNMIWVVDGTRLENDYSRFLKGLTKLQETQNEHIYSIETPHKYFNSSWLNSSVPVIFDFLGTKSLDINDDPRTYLFCLLPFKDSSRAEILILPRDAFIQYTKEGKLFKKKEIKIIHSIKTRVLVRATTRRRESTHYLDPKRGVFRKKRRF